MRAADTNVLVRLIVRDENAQLKAAESFVARGAWISHLVLVETIWVLDSIYGFGHSKLIDAVEMLLAQEQVIVEAPDVVSAAVEVYRRKTSLRFSDCMILEIARKAGNIPLGTFDKDLAKIDGAHKL